MSDTIEIVGLTKRFGDVIAVNEVTFTVQPGELLTLLGPSGCGKTTLLRLLSGFEHPTTGSIRISGKDVTSLPPHRRDINQVFQSYALFPHLTIRDNIAFGLKMQGWDRADIARKVSAAIDLVSLHGMETRYPHELSGGQRQRVALARAIVPEPRILLLDEPLSALDAKLRRGMQLELKRLQRKLGLTTILVTHDQDEALALSDTIAVMNAGRIEQIGKGETVYRAPKTIFVAEFLGEANVLQTTLLEVCAHSATFQTANGWKLLSSPLDPSFLRGEQDYALSLRPEKIRVEKHLMNGPNIFRARIAEKVFLGSSSRLVLLTEYRQALTVYRPEAAGTASVQTHDEVFCSFDPEDVIILQS